MPVAGRPALPPALNRPAHRRHGRVLYPDRSRLPSDPTSRTSRCLEITAADAMASRWLRSPPPPSVAPHEPLSAPSAQDPARRVSDPVTTRRPRPRPGRAVPRPRRHGLGAAAHAVDRRSRHGRDPGLRRTRRPRGRSHPADRRPAGPDPARSGGQGPRARCCAPRCAATTAQRPSPCRPRRTSSASPRAPGSRFPPTQPFLGCRRSIQPRLPCSPTPPC